MGKRVPNTGLTKLIDESGMSEKQFIRAVNRLAAESGISVRYDQPSVSQWRGGTTPRAAVRPFIAEVLARRLGRPLTFAELGFPAPDSSPSERTYPRIVEELVDIGRNDMDPSRRGVLSSGLYSVAFSIPAWPDIVDRMEATQTGHTRRIGRADVDAVTAMTERLSQLDGHFGGRYARPMAAAFLVNTVTPYLRADGSNDVRKAMLSAAAFLCYLTGWMAVDERLHGLAQRYYAKGLELAGSSADHTTYCHILRGMSVQAVDLGHGASALRLANAAAAASPSSGPRMRAFFAGQQAHAHAVTGDRANALRALRETEVAMDKAESQTATFGGYSPSTLAYHQAQVRYALGDIAGSVTAFQLHFRLRDPSDSRRSRVRFKAMLAERQLEMGHVEMACSTWNHVLDDYPSVQSGRADEQVTQLRALLRPYLSHTEARNVYERARDISARRQVSVGV